MTSGSRIFDVIRIGPTLLKTHLRRVWNGTWKPLPQRGDTVTVSITTDGDGTERIVCVGPTKGSFDRHGYSYQDIVGWRFIFEATPSVLTSVHVRKRTSRDPACLPHFTADGGSAPVSGHGTTAREAIYAYAAQIEHYAGPVIEVLAPGQFSCEERIEREKHKILKHLDYLMQDLTHDVDSHRADCYDCGSIEREAYVRVKNHLESDLHRARK